MRSSLLTVALLLSCSHAQAQAYLDDDEFALDAAAEEVNAAGASSFVARVAVAPVG